MTRLVRVLGMVALVATQEPAAPAASQRNEIDIVHHLANSHTLEVPSFRPPYYKEVDLPQFTPFRVGRLQIDLSPTRHVVFLVLAAVLVGLVFLYTSRAVALVSLAVIEISGMRALGVKGYLGTIFYLPPGLPAALKPAMLVIMTPIEIIGKLAKPFALAVRLFANMTAGHVVVLALIGLTFFFQSYLVGVAASAMATGIMLLELFVAFLQAFVFTLLTSVFIGLMRAAH